MGQDTYIILTNQSEDRLAAEVNHKIADGYWPIGGVAVRPGSTQTGYMFHQAMVLQTAQPK